MAVPETWSQPSIRAGSLTDHLIQHSPSGVVKPVMKPPIYENDTLFYKDPGRTRGSELGASPTGA